MGVVVRGVEVGHVAFNVGFCGGDEVGGRSVGCDGRGGGAGVRGGGASAG